VKRKPGKPADDSITEFVIDQLRSLGPVEARSMFGGRGLYWREMIFGLVDEGRVYFRVGESTVERYREKGSKPFEPWPGHIMAGYWELPADVLEDADEAAGWAKEAWSLPRTNPRKKKAPR
jgi:DNA transformation protein and related proteins